MQGVYAKKDGLCMSGLLCGVTGCSGLLSSVHVGPLPERNDPIRERMSSAPASDEEATRARVGLSNGITRAVRQYVLDHKEGYVHRQEM